MLFRIGDEKARATSIVRYAPGSSFAPHVHTGGEEFLVLEGTFQDEAGDYPAGTYVRNPPGTSHAPAARDGATIFVRLWQFRADDRAPTVRLPGEVDLMRPRVGGRSALQLFDDGHEEIRIEQWDAGAQVTVANDRGIEFLLVAGEIMVGGAAMAPQDWGRLPAGCDLEAVTGPAGATVWLRLAPPLHSDVCPY